MAMERVMAERIARHIVERTGDNGERNTLYLYGLRIIGMRVKRLRDESSDAYCREVQDGAESYFWECLIGKVSQLWERKTAEFAAKDPQSGLPELAERVARYIVGAASKTAVWRGRRAAAHAMRFSEGRGEVGEPCATDCPVEERPPQTWQVRELVERIKVSGEDRQGSAAAKLAGQLRSVAVLASMGMGTRTIGQTIGVSHQTCANRLKELREFLPAGKRPPIQDDTPESLAALEESVGAATVRAIVRRRRMLADAAALADSRESLRCAYALRIVRRGPVGAASYSASDARYRRGAGLAPAGVSPRHAAAIRSQWDRRAAELLDSIRPAGVRRVEYLPMREPADTLPIATAPRMLEAQARENAQESYDAPRYAAAARRILARIESRRAVGAANSV